MLETQHMLERFNERIMHAGSRTRTFWGKFERD